MLYFFPRARRGAPRRHASLTAHRRAYTLLHAVDTVDADGDGVVAEVGLAHFFLPMRQWTRGDA